jgi:hypothetical protein
MTKYLMDCEQDVLLRPETRRLTLRNGTVQSVTLFDVTWRWYDRLNMTLWADEPGRILELAENFARDEDRTLDDALASMIEFMVEDTHDLIIEMLEGDALIDIQIAQSAIQEFHKRNKGSA